MVSESVKNGVFVQACLFQSHPKRGLISSHEKPDVCAKHKHVFFQKLSALLGSPCTKDLCILGYMLGPLHVGNPQKRRGSKVDPTVPWNAVPNAESS